jgi:hypothetical protein
LLLLAVWAVLGAARFWRRWLASLAALAGLYGASIAGMAADEVSRADLHVYSANVFALLLVFLCAQAPLWLLRTGLRRGLRHEDDTAAATEGGLQFQTRDLLTALALIAVALGLARLTILFFEAGGSGDSTNLWLNLALACVLFGAWSALVVVPCVGATWLVRRHGLASVAVAVFGAVTTGVVGTVLALVFGDGAPVRDTVTQLLALHAGLFTVVLGGCYLLRSWGYTLR